MIVIDVWRLSVNARGEGLEPVARTYRWFMLGAGLVATGIATVGCDLFTGLADEQYAAVRLQVPLLNVAMLCQCGATVAASAFFMELVHQTAYIKCIKGCPLG